MTAAVGRVAGSAVGRSAAGGSSFQGAASLGIERPPAGHFDTLTAPKKTEPAAPKKTESAAPKKTEPAESTGGISIAPPAPTVPEVPSAVNTGAGFVLGLLFWTWIALPFLNNGGVTGVKNQLRAKFFNKAPDGSWLP